MIRDMLRMGDPRLLQRVGAGRALRHARAGRAARRHARHDGGHDGAGLAAPQIGVRLQVVIFGVERNAALSRRRAGAVHRARQSGADAAVGRDWRRTGRAACRCPGCAASCRATRGCATRASTRSGQPIEREVDGFHARVVQHECDHLAGHPVSDAHPRFHRSFGFTDVLFPARTMRRDE